MHLYNTSTYTYTYRAGNVNTGTILAGCTHQMEGGCNPSFRGDISEISDVLWHSFCMCVPRSALHYVITLNPFNVSTTTLHYNSFSSTGISLPYS